MVEGQHMTILSQIPSGRYQPDMQPTTPAAVVAADKPKSRGISFQQIVATFVAAMAMTPEKGPLRQ